MSGERKTVLYAIAANAAIAIVKAVAGLLTGSAAMLAEAAHSVADTANQGFLLVSLSLADRPPDDEHPFGHGKDRFFWSFLASVLIFFTGAIFSIGQGVLQLVRGSEKGSYGIAYGTLAFAFVAEGVSLARAVKHTRDEARKRRRGFFEHVRVSTEPTAKTVLGEDTVAVVGIIIAFVGIGLHQLTGQTAWDAGAAIAVGVLLIYVAITLGRNFRDLLIGAGARPEERQRILDILQAHDEIVDVVDLRTMYVGPEALLVAARVDLADGLTAAEIEELANELDQELRDAVPAVSEVFLDPTPRWSRTVRATASATS
jgi:cation diffusion facilitator family transporter